MSHFENLSEEICLLENLEFAVNDKWGRKIYKVRFVASLPTAFIES